MRIEVNTAGATGLGELPSEMRRRLQRAIRAGLRAGKSESRLRITARYTAKSPLSLGSVKSRVAGLDGALIFSGSRSSIPRFILRPASRPPHNPPGGLYVQVVRGQGGRLPHAFIGRGQVFERVGRGRTPIKKLTTIGLPGMAKAVAEPTLSKMGKTAEGAL